MDELTLLREHRPDRPLLAGDDLLPARLALLNAIADDQRSTRHVPRRWLLAGTVVAAASAAVVALAPAIGPAHHSATAVADPVTVLDQAARYATSQPFAVPRPVQFVFIAPSSWLSVDGTHDGAIGRGNAREVVPGCRNGKRVIVGANDPRNNGTLEPCTPNPAYLADVPTDPSLISAYLRNRTGLADPSPGQLLKTVQDVLTDWLSPAAQAAVFRGVTTLPGLHLIGEVGVQGRHGVGVSWGDAGGTLTLVFDRVSHRYLGLTTLGMHGEPGSGLKQPTAIVDRVGQLPG